MDGGSRRSSSHCTCQAQTQTGGSFTADGTQTLAMARAMSYLASPYRPMGHPVTYKLAEELEGFGIFASLGNSRSQAGTVDSLFCRKHSAQRVVDGVESTYRPGQIREILDQLVSQKIPHWLDPIFNFGFGRQGSCSMAIVLCRQSGDPCSCQQARIDNLSPPSIPSSSFVATVTAESIWPSRR